MMWINFDWDDLICRGFDLLDNMHMHSVSFECPRSRYEARPSENGRNIILFPKDTKKKIVTVSSERKSCM